MFFKNLQKLFLAITVIASILLVYLWYQDYSFANKPLADEYKQAINKKQIELKKLAYQKFKITRSFPIYISDNMNAKQFGMTTYKDGKISIYLNKKRFKENSNYMIDDVLPHEYAHAIMFAMNDFTNINSGHTKKWQYICKKLNGLRCDRFVNNNDILIEKTNPFKKD